MATGYNTRQPGRDTFASQGPPIQQLGRGTSSGESRGAQLVGGNAVAGGAPNVQITVPGSDAEQLGSFFTKLFEPYVQRKQQQRFFEGFTRAQSGEAIEELSKSHNSVVGQLFGPTSLEQGAQFYTAMKKVDDWQSNMLENMDDLKQLTPTDLSKHLAQTSIAMMGDDPDVNMLVQKQLVEKSGPLVDTVAKKRYSWQQDTARQTMFDALGSSATAFQKSATAIKDVTAPTDDETAAMTVSRHSFLGMMQKPQGMADDTYQATLTNAMTSFAQDGNFYAYTAMQEAGVFNVLDDTQQKKVQDAYDRYKKPALDDAKGKYVEDLLKVDEGISKGGLSPLEAVAAVDKINAQISRDTGIKERAFDADQLRTTGVRVIDMIAAQRRRQEDRQQTKDDQERDAREKHSAALGAFNLGQPRSFSAAGGDGGMLNQVYFEEYRDGRFMHKFAKAFRQEGYVNEAVSKLMQSKLTSSGGVDFTEEAKKGYEEWSSLYKLDSGAAAGYYGDQHPKMLFMQRLVSAGVDPRTAYTRAFASEDKGRYSGQTLRPSDRKETMEAIAPVVKNFGSGWVSYNLGFGTRPMGEQAQNVLTNVITETAAIYQRSGELGPNEVAEQAARVAKANNSFEYYGGNLAWRNRPGTKTIGQYIGTREKDTGEILHGEIDDRLKQVDYPAGADGRYEIIRTPTPGGFVLTVAATDELGKVIIITSQELKARADKRARGELQDNQPNRNPRTNTGMDSNRVGPGK